MLSTRSVNYTDQRIAQKILGVGTIFNPTGLTTSTFFKYILSLWK